MIYICLYIYNLHVSAYSHAYVTCIQTSNRHSIPICHICRCQRPGPELKTMGHGGTWWPESPPMICRVEPTTGPHIFEDCSKKNHWGFHVLERWNFKSSPMWFWNWLVFGSLQNKTNQEEFLQIRWNWWKVSVVSDFGALRLCPETIQQLDIFW